MLVVSINSELVNLGLKKIFEDNDHVQLVCSSHMDPQVHPPKQTLYITGLSKCEGATLELLTSRQHKCIVLLDTKFDRPTIRKLLRSSISGFLSLESTKEEIIKCLDQVRNGMPHLPQEVAGLLLNDSLKLSQFRLSERECEILELLSQGKTLQQISELLFLSKNTVVTHKRNILKKTGFNKMTQLIAWWKGV